MPVPERPESVCGYDREQTRDVLLDVFDSAKNNELLSLDIPCPQIQTRFEHGITSEWSNTFAGITVRASHAHLVEPHESGPVTSWKECELSVRQKIETFDGPITITAAIKNKYRGSAQWKISLDTREVVFGWVGIDVDYFHPLMKRDNPRIIFQAGAWPRPANPYTSRIVVENEWTFSPDGSPEFSVKELLDLLQILRVYSPHYYPDGQRGLVKSMISGFDLMDIYGCMYDITHGGLQTFYPSTLQVLSRIDAQIAQNRMATLDHTLLERRKAFLQNV